MPIYEYRCQDCKKKVSVFFRALSAVDHSTAPLPTMRWQGISRGSCTASAPSLEESRMDSLADDSMLSGLDENDPKSMGRMLRKMARETGEDMRPNFG